VVRPARPGSVLSRDSPRHLAERSRPRKLAVRKEARHGRPDRRGDVKGMAPPRWKVAVLDVREHGQYELMIHLLR
jgi:hypothetical protein